MPELAIECVDDDVVFAYRAGVARHDWWRLWKQTRHAVKPPEPACWELRPDHQGLLRRIRLWGRKDFTGATTRSGRRGVIMWFTVIEGRQYLIRQPMPRGRVAFTRIRVIAGNIEDIQHA